MMVLLAKSQELLTNAAASLGYKIETEVSPFNEDDDRFSLPQEMLAIDMADASKMIAIEFDGPSHYVTNVRTGEVAENGPTKAKRLFLQRLGWTVINIPWFEWAKASDQTSFLKRKLEQSGLKVVD